MTLFRRSRLRSREFQPSCCVDTPRVGAEGAYCKKSLDSPPRHYLNRNWSVGKTSQWTGRPVSTDLTTRKVEPSRSCCSSYFCFKDIDIVVYGNYRKPCVGAERHVIGGPSLVLCKYAHISMPTPDAPGRSVVTLEQRLVADRYLYLSPDRRLAMSENGRVAEQTMSE